MSIDAAAQALRERILALTYQCPRGDFRADCPFGILKGLSHESRLSTLALMQQGELLRLFDLISACDCPADPRQQAPGAPEPPA